jgi:hypothetical protein
LLDGGAEDHVGAEILANTTWLVEPVLVLVA